MNELSDEKPIWVFDTSSIVNVKRLIRERHRKKVFDHLSTIRAADQLV